jgi:Protein of unknown function (DUF2917)
MSRLSMHETQRLLVVEPAWLIALGARLWVTRDGDPADHVLGAGERLFARRGDRLLVGPFDRDTSVDWELQRAARAQAWPRRLVGAAFDAAARTLRGAADGLAALARSAAAMACRAQGCIKAGDSMASAGTVQ